MTVKAIRRVGLAAAGVVAAGVFAFGATSMANAEAAAPAPSASGSTGSGGPGQRGGSADTAVTGDELAKVIAAMKAKDAAVTVTSVRKDPDGSYDVLGTKDGARVFYDVSADLKTFTQDTGRGPGGDRGHNTGTAVTGDELAKVTAAVKAKDSAVTVGSVRKGADGTYRVLGTKDGARVAYRASADLLTVTLDTHRRNK